MADCRLCGAPIIWKQHNGRMIALDAHEVTRGEHRYAIAADGLVPIRAAADVSAHTDHRSTCVYRERMVGQEVVSDAEAGPDPRGPG